MLLVPFKALGELNCPLHCLSLLKVLVHVSLQLNLRIVDHRVKAEMYNLSWGLTPEHQSEALKLRSCDGTLYSPYLKLFQLQFKLLVVNIEVLLPVFQDVVRLLLQVAEQQLAACIQALDALNPREAKCLVGLHGAKKFTDVFQPGMGWDAMEIHGDE